MRILKLLYNVKGKGTYWRALGFAQQLVKNGHQVTLVSTDRESRFSFKYETVNGVELLLAPDLFGGSLRSGWDPHAVLRRLWHLRNQQFDLIHAYESRPTVIYPGLYLSRQQKIPLVTDWCDWFGAGGSVEQRPNPLIKTVLRPVETHFENYYRPFTHGITVINSILEAKAKMFGFRDQQIHFLPNGVDPDLMHPRLKQFAQKKCNLDPSNTYIGYTGAIFLSDAELLGHAFDLVRKTLPKARLLMIGYSNVDMRDYVLANNRSAVIHTGPVPFDQLIDFISACDIGCLPLVNHNANRGRFPLKLFDFMTLARPVVVTNTGDLGKTVQKHQAGFVTDDFPESLAEGLVSMARASHKVIEFGENGRNAIQTYYSWSLLTERLESFYQSVQEFHRKQQDFSK